MWARMNLIEQRADFGAVALPNYATEQYFFSFYEAEWLVLDERVFWTVVAWTERWHAIEIRGELAATIDDLLENSRVLQFGLEGAITAPAHQIQIAISLIRIAGTAYEAIVDADDDQLDFNVDEVATRMRDRNYITHLHVMGWYAEGLQTILIAAQRSAFNAVTQTDWGDEAVAALNTEMVSLFQRLGTMAGTSPAMYHNMLVAQAEMTGHGYIPEALIQLLGFLPGESGIGTAGAIWIEVPVNASNGKTLACTLKVLVPEGVSIDFLDVELVHNYANALFTRYVNVDTPVAVDMDNFFVSNFDDVGVGHTKLFGDVAASLVGGAGGTVFDIGTFNMHYLTIGTPNVELSPRPYWMDPLLVSAEEGHTPTVFSTVDLTFGGFTCASGDKIILDETSGNPDIILEAGVDFDDGATAGSANALAAGIADAINLVALTMTALAVANVITLSSIEDDGTDPADVVVLGAALNADLGTTDATPSEATLTLGSFTTVDGNTITLVDLSGGPDHVLVAGTDFDNGATAGSADALATAIAGAIDLLPGYGAAAVTNAVTVTVEDAATLKAGTDPADVTFVGAEIIADMGGAAEAFAGAVDPAGEAWAGGAASIAGADASGNFFMKGLRMQTGLRNDGGRNYLFPEMEEGLSTP